MTSPPLELRTFVEETLQSAGALADARDDQTWDVLLPPELAPSLGGDLVRLTLSPDRPGELVAPGSPALDALLGWAVARGRVAAGYLDADVRKVLTLEDVLAEIRCYNCRPAMESVTVGHHHRGLFTFRVTYLLDDRHEELRQVWVHLELAKESSPYQHVVVSEIPQEVAEGPFPPLGPAYPVACRAVSRQASARAAELLAQGERLASREIQRISAYFEAYEAELHARLASAGDEGRRQRLESKLAAARRERASKIEDARRKHRLTVEARLVALAILRAPAIRACVRLVERSHGITGALTLFWDAVGRRLELALCPCCRQELREVCLCPQCRQPVCRACLKHCNHPASTNPGGTPDHEKAGPQRPVPMRQR